MRPSPSSPARRPPAPEPAGLRWSGQAWRSAWWWVTAVLTTVGVAGSFLAVGALASLVILGAGTVGTTMARYQLRLNTEGRLTWPPVLDVLGGWCLLAAVGLAAQFNAVGVGVSAAVIAARALRLHRKRRPADPPPDPPAEVIPCDPLPEPSDVATLSTPQLCWAWRLSFGGTQRRDCPAYQLEYLRALRSACLDELERRDPVAFRRWLPTARAASDPGRFFCPPAHP